MRTLFTRYRVSQFATNYARNDDGAVAIVFGLSVIALVLAAGVAVDSSRLLHTTTRIQRALDAAAIAAARKLDVEGTSTSDVEQAANNYFNAQLQNSILSEAALNNFTASSRLKR